MTPLDVLLIALSCLVIAGSVEILRLRARLKRLAAEAGRSSTTQTAESRRVTIEPGESRAVGVPIPAWIVEAQRQGRKVTFEQHPARPAPGGGWASEVYVMLDGQPTGSFVLEYNGERDALRIECATK